VGFSWACHPDAHALPLDATSDAPTDALEDQEAGLVWLTVCEQYYAQAQVTSGACIDCENGACVSETGVSVSACGDATDSDCMVMCEASPPPKEDCNCLRACLTAACEDALAVTETCQMGACASSCK